MWFFIGKEICLRWVPKSRFHHELNSQTSSGQSAGKRELLMEAVRQGFLRKKSWFGANDLLGMFFFKIGFFRCYLNMLSSVYSLHLLESTNDSNDHDGIHLKRLETTDFSLNLWNWPLQDLTSLSWFLLNKLKNWFKKTLWILQLDMKSEQNLRFFFGVRLLVEKRHGKS